MKAYRRLPDAFTLIELLVVIGFIIVFSTFSVAYFNQFTEEKKLENATKKISTVLSLVKAKSTSGDSSMCTGGPGITPMIRFYSFEVLNEDQYSIQPNCEAGTPRPVIYTNETNVVFDITPFPVVTFFPVTGGSRCTYIYLKNSTLNQPGGKCRYVKTTEAGIVKEDVCTDCTSCPTTCP